MLTSAGTTFEAAVEERKAAVSSHNRVEAVHYAASLERKALAAGRTPA